MRVLLASAAVVLASVSAATAATPTSVQDSYFLEALDGQSSRYLGIDAAASRDGSTVAWVRQLPGSVELDVSRAPFRTHRRLLVESRIGDVAVSPAGAHIAYTRGDQVVVVDAGARAMHVAGTGLVQELDWASDGRRLTGVALSPAPNGAPILGAIVVIAGGTIEPLPFTGTTPRWQPHGDLIAYDDAPGRTIGVLRLTDARGSIDRVVGAVVAGTASWSPDGRRLAYLDPQRGLMLFDVATRRATNRLRYARGHPLWSSDGRRLLLGVPLRFGQGPRLTEIPRVAGAARIREHGAFAADVPLVAWLRGGWILT